MYLDFSEMVETFVSVNSNTVDMNLATEIINNTPGETSRDQN